MWAAFEAEEAYIAHLSATAWQTPAPAVQIPLPHTQGPCAIGARKAIAVSAPAKAGQEEALLVLEPPKAGPVTIAQIPAPGGGSATLRDDSQVIASSSAAQGRTMTSGRAAGSTSFGHAEVRGGHVFLNPGSVGHPELCSRACLHFAAGRCRNGGDCDFCHATHTKPTKQLDKRQRDALRSLPLPEVHRLLEPHVLNKIYVVDSSRKTLRAVESLAIACGRGHGVPCFRPPSQMVAALQDMSLRHLLALFEDSAARSGSGEVLRAVRALLSRLLRAPSSRMWL